MSNYHTKAVRDYIRRLSPGMFAQAPCRETLRRIARDPHYPQTGQGLVDRSTGEFIDIEKLSPYMEEAGFNYNVAMRLYLSEEQNNA